MEHSPPLRKTIRLSTPVDITLLQCFDKKVIIHKQAVAALAGLPKGGKAYDCDTIVTIRNIIRYSYCDSDIRHLENQEQQ